MGNIDTNIVLDPDTTIITCLEHGAIHPSPPSYPIPLLQVPRPSLRIEQGHGISVEEKTASKVKQVPTRFHTAIGLHGVTHAIP